MLPALAEFGYSRDHCPERSQINIALLVDREGLPIAHSVVKGNLWVYELPKPLGTAYEKARDAKDRQARSRAKSEGKPAPRRPVTEPRFIAVYNPVRAVAEKQERRAKLRERVTQPLLKSVGITQLPTLLPEMP